MISTATPETGPPTAAEKRDGSRNIIIILLHNLPLAVVYLAFGFWRAARNDIQAGCDFICGYTNRFGDQLPIVASVRAKFAETGAPIDVELGREILFFNIVIGIWAIPITVLAYILYVRQHGVFKDRKIRAKSPIRVILATMFLLTVMVIMIIVPFAPKDIVLTHWVGLFVSNLMSVCISMVLMVFVLHVYEWSAAIEEKRQDSSV